MSKIMGFKLGLGACFMAASLFGGCLEVPRLLSLSRMTDQEVQEFLRGELGDDILVCERGTCIPLKLSMNGPFLKLGHEPGSAFYWEVMKTCYLRCEQGDRWLISPDLEKWGSFQEFFTNSVILGVEVENGEPIVSLEYVLDEGE